MSLKFKVIFTTTKCVLEPNQSTVEPLTQPPPMCVHHFSWYCTVGNIDLGAVDDKAGRQDESLLSHV